MRKILKGLIIAGFCVLSCSNLVYAGTSKATSSDANQQIEDNKNEKIDIYEELAKYENKYSMALGNNHPSFNIELKADSVPNDEYIRDYYESRIPESEYFNSEIVDLERTHTEHFEKYIDSNGTVKETKKLYGRFVGKLYVYIKPTDEYMRRATIHAYIEPVEGYSETQYIYDSRKKSSIGSNSSSDLRHVGRNLYTGSWEQDGGAWKLALENGKYAKSQWAFVNEKWYLFGADGYMLTGWQKANDKWYLLGADGAMLTGWQKTGDKWYYLTENGDMLSNTVTPDGYSVDSNGAWIE